MKKVLVVEAAVASDITGKFYNRYIFKTSRNSFHDACAGAAATMAPASLAFLAQDNVFGKDGIAAARDCLSKMGSKAKVVHEEYAPPASTDFTAPGQRLIDALKKHRSRASSWWHGRAAARSTSWPICSRVATTLRWSRVAICCR
jgi:branched-chain amino acid transport system substrate-binding protein